MKRHKKQKEQKDQLTTGRSELAKQEPMDELLLMADVVRLVKIGHRTIERMTKLNQFPKAIYPRHKLRRFRRSDIEAWMKNLGQPQ